MNCTEDVTIGLASNGMIVRRPTSADAEAECYVISNTGLYPDGTNHHMHAVSLSRLWLIWFGTFPLLAAIIYALVNFFGS